MADGDAQTDARNDAADEQVHETVLSGCNQREGFKQALRHTQKERQRYHAHDGAYHELSAQCLEGDEQQQAVDDQHRRADGYPEGVVQQGGNTGHSARYDLFGQNEGREAYGVNRTPQKHKERVLDLEFEQPAVYSVLKTAHHSTMLTIFLGTIMTFLGVLP